MKANITTDDEVVLFSSSIMVHDGNKTQYHHFSDGYPIRTMEKKKVQNINLISPLHLEMFRCFTNHIREGLYRMWVRSVHMCNVKIKTSTNSRGPRTVQVKGKSSPGWTIVAGAVELFEICTTVVAEIFRGWFCDCLLPLVGCPVGRVGWMVRILHLKKGRFGPGKRHCLVSRATKFQEFLLLVIVGFEFSAKTELGWNSITRRFNSWPFLSPNVGREVT